MMGAFGLGGRRRVLERAPQRFQREPELYGEM